MPPAATAMLPNVLETTLEPRSEPEVSFDDLMVQVERRMEETDQIHTSDDGTPNRTREILTEAVTAPLPPQQHYLHEAKQLDSPHGIRTRLDGSDMKLEVPQVYDSQRGSPEHGFDCRASIDEFINDIVDFPDVPEEDESSHSMGRGLQQQLDACQNVVMAEINREPTKLNEGLLKVDLPNGLAELRTEPSSVSLKALLAIQGITTYHVSTTDEARLNWVPYDMRQIRSRLGEEWHHNGNSQNFLAVPDKVTRSSELLWKDPGLRVLDLDEETNQDVDIDLALVDEKTGPPALHAGDVRDATKDVGGSMEEPSPAEASELDSESPVRYITTNGPAVHQPVSHTYTQDPFESIEIVNESTNAPASEQTGDAPSSRFRATVVKDADSVVRKRRSTPQVGVTPTPFSASISLASFLDLRGKRFKTSNPPIDDLTDSSADGRDTTEPSPSILGTAQRPLLPGLGPRLTCKGDTDQVQSSHRTNNQSTRQIEVPSTPNAGADFEAPSAPDSEPITDARVVIFDEALVRNRSLMTLINQQNEDNLRAIYRNLGGSVDIILNATTGLILTNIQALKQKNLPGQKSQGSNTLQSRIRSASAPYQTIFVLITANSTAVESSSHLIAEFTAFCAALRPISTRICPLWIMIPSTTLTLGALRPPSDPVTAWTWRLIAQHSQRVRGDMSFIDDTTLWELFLRRAGVNALAAQLMLGMLKRDALPLVAGEDVDMQGSDGDGGPARGKWGLRRLVAMSPQERRQMFGEYVGKKCLACLAQALDGVPAG